MLCAADFPNPIVDNKDAGAGKQTAVLSGGCFWCVEVVYQQIAGVEKVISGYSGGDASTAHYDMVSMGTTGHAESVQVTYDPRKGRIAGHNIGPPSFIQIQNTRRLRN